MTDKKDLSDVTGVTTHRMKPGEADLLDKIAQNFDRIPIATAKKLENFPNWVRHRDLARFLFKAQMFQEILTVPGAIFECGVHYGGGLTTWLHLSEIFEPVNFSRRIFGFDTFEGFVDVAEEDMPKESSMTDGHRAGFFNIGDARESVFEVFSLVDQTRKVPQLQRLHWVQGDARKTVPAALEADKSILVSLLYLDMDLYRPTKEVLEACLPRMPKGAIIVFDDLCYEDWPGETQALFESFNLNEKTLVRSPTVPNITYLRV